MRSGEFTCASLTHFQDHMLSPRDISVDSQTQPSVISVLFRRSKTDTFGRGMSVFMGQTSHTVAAILGYLAQRGVAHGPLFIHTDGSTLSRQRLVTVIRSALQSQGVDSSVLSAITGHSFRIGAATTAARAGMQDSTIQSLGRWRSSTFLRYIRTPGRQLAAVCWTKFVRHELYPLQFCCLFVVVLFVSFRFNVAWLCCDIIEIALV